MENIDQPRIQLLKQIGLTAYDAVWFARYHQNDTVKYIAVKLENENTPIDSLKNEFVILERIDYKYHENLIKYYEYAENVQRFQHTGVNTVQYLALKHYSATLLDYLMGAKPQTEDQWGRYWFRQILNGLKHINLCNYAHLDIKCENILLDHHLIVKIGNFGFADLKEWVATSRGSGLHRAPEICRHQFPYDGEKADVFALGIVLFAIKMRSFPVEQTVHNVVDSNQY